MDTINNLLLNLTTNNSCTISNAENQINSLFKSNYYETLHFLSSLFSDLSTNIKIRKVAIILIKNSLLSNNYLNLWLNLDNELKNKIKINIISSLGIEDNYNNKEVIRLIANCISSFAAIEFPRNSWKDIFNTLFEALNNANLNFQYAALITIQYILQDINIADLKACESGEILGIVINKLVNESFINNINVNAKYINSEINVENIVNFYVSIVKELIPFIEDIIQDNNKQVILINNLFVVYKAYCFTNIKVCIIDIFFNLFLNYYSFINKELVINDLLNFAKYSFNEYNNYINNKNSINFNFNLIYNTLELWSYIAEIESNLTTIKSTGSLYYNIKNKKYCIQVYKDLLKIILNILENSNTNNIINEDNEYEDIEDPNHWNIEKSCYLLILNLSSCTTIDFIESLYAFIIKGFNSNDIVIKERAIHCYAYIIDSQNSNCLIKNSIIDNLNMFFSICNITMLKNNSIDINSKNIKKIRKACGIAILKSIKKHSDSILENKENSCFLYKKLIELIADYVNIDVNFCKKILQSINTLFYNSNKKGNTYYLKKYKHITYFIDNLLKII